MNPADQDKLDRLTRMEAACCKCKNVEFLDLSLSGPSGFCIRDKGRQSTRLDLIKRCPAGNKDVNAIINGRKI